eukprot:33922-Eustigmatos_ZCMA.PRE.1
MSVGLTCHAHSDCMFGDDQPSCLPVILGYRGYYVVRKCAHVQHVLYLFRRRCSLPGPSRHRVSRYEFQRGESQGVMSASS